MTALPYIDEKQIDDTYKSKVSNLIKLEMEAMQSAASSSGQKDYLENLPLPKLKHLVRIQIT